MNIPDSRKKWLYLSMVFVAIFSSIDYGDLVLSGNTSARRIFALGAWVLIAIIWIVLFIR